MSKDYRGFNEEIIEQFVAEGSPGWYLRERLMDYLKYLEFRIERLEDKGTECSRNNYREDTCWAPLLSDLYAELKISQEKLLSRSESAWAKFGFREEISAITRKIRLVQKMEDMTG